MFVEKIAGLTQQYPLLRQALMPAVLLRRQWLRSAKKPDAASVTGTLASMLAEDPVLNVVEFEGKFALSPKSHIFRRLVEDGQYEPVLTRRCLELLDSRRDVIDVGANVGFHTVLLAKHIDADRRLLAVEPTRNALGRLRRNIALNGVEARVSVFEGVASDATGSLEIKTIAGLEEYSSLGVMEHPSIAGAGYVTEHVEARTLDQLVEDYKLDCGFLKVDVEGVEHRVFNGGRRVLTEARPVVVSELSDALLRKNGSSALEVVQFFEALNYVVADPLRPGEKPGYREFGDILCVPRERSGA